MADDPKRTPVPGAVHAKMQTGLRQRYAMATTPSANPGGETKGVTNAR